MNKREKIILATEKILIESGPLNCKQITDLLHLEPSLSSLIINTNRVSQILRQTKENGLGSRIKVVHYEKNKCKVYGLEE